MRTYGIIVHNHSLHLHAILQLQQQLCGISIAGCLTLEDGCGEVGKALV